MDSLQSVLPKVLRKRGLYAHAQSAQVVHLAQRWLEQALPSFAAFVRVHTLSHATLTIACSHSIAAQECQQVAPMLREFLAPLS
ncbi:DUF721 domain-containing protein [Candidatus Peregrinibacteria bacterium]|nr:DUF721 domain-containing protein [Candidatus Peregrinibacteria bacterium]